MYHTIGDARIFVTTSGSKTAPAILALGGWIGSWEDWIDPLSILSQDWHTIAFDHRGSGVTIAPPESISLDRLVDDVFAVLDACGVNQCVLAAMSMGALVAFAAALKQPARFSGLVIVDGLYSRPPIADDDPFLEQLAHDYPATIARFIDACVPETDAAHFRYWGRHILARASQESAIRLYRMGGSRDLRADLPRISLPTLILHGDQDAILPLASSRRLADMLPHSKLVVLPGAGHVPIMTRPHDVAAAINEFFGVPIAGRPE